MAQPPTLDPFALWRDLVSQMEKGVNEVADPAMKSDEFAKVANKVVGATVAGKALKREMMNRYFGALNLPTRSDIDAISDRLQAIEDRLIGMSATLDRLAGVTPRAGTGLAVPMPARTKKPPAARPAPAPAPTPAGSASPVRKTRKAPR